MENPQGKTLTPNPTPVREGDASSSSRSALLPATERKGGNVKGFQVVHGSNLVLTMEREGGRGREREIQIDRQRE